MRGRGLTLDGVAARINAVAALRAASSPKAADGEALRAAAAELDAATPDIEHVAAAVCYSAFADLLRLAADLVDWRRAVLAATVDADRFLRAAKAKGKLWPGDHGARPGTASLADIGRLVDGVDDVAAVAPILDRLAATPLPLGLIKTQYRPRIPGRLAEDDPEAEPAPARSELAVAFVKFTLDGAPAADTHYLSPDQNHDVEIEVRVSRWPAEAETLELRPMTIEHADTYQFPVFTLPKPKGDPPYQISDRGRALLKVPQSLQARPYEFRYTAQFKPTEAEAVLVVGQRTLRIDSVDLKQNSLTGYPRLDAKIVQLRDDLRGRPLVLQAELADALTVLIPMANFAGRCLQDNLVREPWSEARFQAEIRGELRRTPAIGAELEEHPRAAGGITDLSFRGIRIELKVEPARRLTLADCEAYLDQTASYVVAGGKRIGILCVLDCSPKGQAPFPAEDGLGVSILQTAQAPVCILVLLIQGNLARPSDLSR